MYYLLPFALWEVVLLSKNLSLFSRKRLLEITKFIFANEYKFLSLNSNKQFSEKFTKNATRISFYSKEKLRRILNTIIGLYFSLEYYPENLALNRISSHPLENTFGGTRMIMQNKIGINAFLSSLTRNIFRTNLLEDLNIELDMYRKVSDAGIHIIVNESININLDFEKIKHEISDLRYCISCNKCFNYQNTELKSLIEILLNDASIEMEKSPTCTVSGSSIVARNFASKT